MYAPFLVLFIPLWLGVLTGPALLMWGHVLMFTAMAILIRIDEYTSHRHPGSPDAGVRHGNGLWPNRLT